MLASACFITLYRSIIVATSALQTGANLPATLLSIFYGYAYSPEGIIQGAGRSGREPGTTGRALLIATTHSEREALAFGKLKHRGLLQVSDLLKSDDFETALMALFDQPPPLQMVAQSQRPVMAMQSQQTQPFHSFSALRPQSPGPSLQMVAQSQRPVTAMQSQQTQPLHSDLSRLSLALRHPHNLPDVGPDICFECGCPGHWSANCPLKTDNPSKTLGRQLFIAGCCTRCGIPKKRISGTLLHTCDSLGRYCTMPVFFLNSLSTHARTSGKKPHEYLSELLQAGISPLITAYAGFVPSDKRPRLH